MSRHIFNHVLSYIDVHIQEKITLAELASLAGYSPFYFSRLFSDTIGIPVTSYIRIRKLQHAMVSLLEGRKVLDVSLMYAFDSHEGFTRSFTQLFGSTPSTIQKHPITYQVPAYVIPSTTERRLYMKNTDTLHNEMHQLIYEILNASFKEADEGFCTEIRITLFPDGSVQIEDNGRGIPLTGAEPPDHHTLQKIFAGHPVSNIEYSHMETFSNAGLQMVNSLCEKLQVCVYRDGLFFQQDYVRGIPQHKITSRPAVHPSGTRITLMPDRAIFKDLRFLRDHIQSWIKEQTAHSRHVEIFLE